MLHNISTIYNCRLAEKKLRGDNYKQLMANSLISYPCQGATILRASNG